MLVAVAVHKAGRGILKKKKQKSVLRDFSFIKYFWSIVLKLHIFTFNMKWKYFKSIPESVGSVLFTNLLFQPMLQFTTFYPHQYICTDFLRINVQAICYIHSLILSFTSFIVISFPVYFWKAHLRYSVQKYILRIQVFAKT